MKIHECRWCGKHVAEKPILGTLHFCRTEDERAAIDRARWRIAEQRRMIESGPISTLAGLWQ